jgi:hypothetical protein
MGSELKEPSPQVAGSYMYDVLADGARAFPFRGGVCTLLGISDRGDGSIKLPPTFHPSGFIRPQHARKECAIPDRHLSSSTVCIFASPAVRGNEQYRSCNQECEVTEPGNMDKLKKETPPERCNGNHGIEREHHAEKLDKAAAGVTSDRIEIPGVTDKKVTFHHLLTTSEGLSQPADHSKDRNSRHDNGSKIEVRSHNEQRETQEGKRISSSKVTNPTGIDCNIFEEPAFHAEKTEKAAASITSDRMDIPGVTDRKVTFDLLSIASQGLFHPSERSDNQDHGMNARRMREDWPVRESLPDKHLQCKKSSIPSYTMKEKLYALSMNGGESNISASLANNHEKRGESASEAKRTMISMQVNKICAGMPEETHFRETANDFLENGYLSGLHQLNGTFGRKTAFEIQNSCVAQHDRDMAGILNTLENHLRHKLDQLRDASQKRPVIGTAITEEAGKNREQEQNHQMQMPLQQRIVVVRHISRRNAAPAAFWERSYLGRFRLRPLR